MPETGELKEKINIALNCLGVETIRIHQIGFLVMYFPVYMLFENLLNDEIKQYIQGESSEIKLNNYEPRLFGKDDIGIKLEFLNYTTDDKIIEEMLTEKNSLADDGKTLNLFLCEPVPFNSRGKEDFFKEADSSNADNKKYKYLIKSDDVFAEKINALRSNSRHNENIYNRYAEIKPHSSSDVHTLHIPFINFPQLFGIALANDPVINIIKRHQAEKMDEEIGRNEKLSKADYWKHFSAKLSLLSKDDLKQLVVSLYPKGSTTDWMLRKRSTGDSTFSPFKFKGNTWVEDIEKEFDDLLKGHVNVAFTVQPWVAVEKSKINDSKPMEIEFVYKNRSVDYDCTSLLFVAKDRSRLILGNYILNLMYLLIQEKVRELYEHDADNMQKYLLAYCYLKRQSCKHVTSTSCNYNYEEGKKDKCEPECSGHTCSCECCDCSLSGKSHNEKHGCIFVNRIALELLADSQIYKHEKTFFKLLSEDDNFLNVQASYFYNKLTHDGISTDQKLGWYKAILNGTCSDELYNFENILIQRSKNIDSYDNNVIIRKLNLVDDISISAYLSQNIGHGSDCFHSRHYTLTANNSNDVLPQEIQQKTKKFINAMESLLLTINARHSTKFVEEIYLHKTDNSIRNTYQNNEFIVNRTNIISLFGESNSERLLYNCDNYDKNMDLHLHIPPRFLMGKFSNIIAESRKENRATGIIRIEAYELNTKSIKKAHISLFIIVLRMADSSWTESCRPEPFKVNEVYDLGFLDKLCDYFIVAPIHNENMEFDAIKIWPVFTLLNNTYKEDKNWINIDNNRVEILSRLSNKINFEHNNNIIQVTSDIDNININTDPNTTLHLLVFDNKRKA